MKEVIEWHHAFGEVTEKVAELLKLPVETVKKAIG